MKHIHTFESFLNESAQDQGLLDAIDKEMKHNEGRFNVSVSTQDLRVLKAAAEGEKVSTYQLGAGPSKSQELTLAQLLDTDQNFKKAYDYLKRKYKF